MKLLHQHQSPRSSSSSLALESCDGGGGGGGCGGSSARHSHSHSHSHSHNHNHNHNHNDNHNHNHSHNHNLNQHKNTLDYDLRNAPSYHAAIMHLLPPSSTNNHHQHQINPEYGASAAIRPMPHQHHVVGHRECLCHKERKHYRKDWRPDDPNAERIVFIQPPHVKPPPPANGKWLLSFHYHHVTIPQCDQDVIVEEEPLADDKSEALESQDLFYSHKTFDPGHFKSSTLYLEVKLAEMLSRHKHSLHDPAVPDVRDIRVCWKLFGELSKQKTPFSQVLSNIHQELDKSVYSTNISVKNGDSTFQRVPYFELVGKLQDRKLAITSEKESIKTEILSRQAEIVNVKHEIKELMDDLTTKETARDMERKLTTVVVSLETTISEVRTLQEEVQKLKIKLQKARMGQILAHQIQCDQMARHERHAKLEENYKITQQNLQEARALVDVLRHEASDRVPKKELEAEKAKVMELKKTLKDLEAKGAAQIDSFGQLTPRPRWNELLDLEGLSGHSQHLLQSATSGRMSTAELLAHVCKQNASLTHTISSLQEDCATARAIAFERQLKDKQPTKGRKGGVIQSPKQPLLKLNETNGGKNDKKGKNNTKRSGKLK